MIRLAACDLDGTIIDGQGRCDPSVARTVDLLHEKGIAFAICSGRPNDSYKPLLKDWGLAGRVDYLIGNNGGEVEETASGRRASFYPLSVEEVRQIIAEYEPLGVIPTLYEGAMFYAERITPLVLRIASRVHTPVKQGHILSLLHTPQYKEMLVVEPQEMTRIEAYEASHRNPDWRGVRTARDLFEFSRTELGKQVGLAAAARMLGITAAEIIAFGDTSNDNSMLSYAGIGVCMANGSEDTRAAADVIAPPVEEQGFARFMNAWLKP